MDFALMQPYFMPYLGYFSLIDSVDEFMFFDSVQFNKKSWMSRNRLLNVATGEPFYIRPDLLSAPSRCSILDVTLQSNKSWENKLIAQLHNYKSVAPYFKEEIGFVEHMLLGQTHANLVDLNINTIIDISNYLGLKTKFSRYTKKEWHFDVTPTAGTWSLEVSKSVGAKKYINAPGGESFILPEGFTSANIHLGFIQPSLSPYNQGDFDFVPGLSIIDVLLFNGRKKTAELVKNYRIDWKC